MADITISICICDDDAGDLKQIETALKEDIQKLGVPVDAVFSLFTEANALYNSACQKAFDLIFLDIEMPGTNGFLLARQLQMKNPEAGVIFVSAHESFVWQSYEYSPIWFVRKSELERDLFLALRRYLEILLPPENFYTAAGRQIPLRDIVYIESSGHMLIFKLVNGSVFEQYGSLRATEAKLAGRGFVRTHKSYLVNQRYIEEIRRRDIRLTDGTLVEMGRDRRKSLCEAMYRYEGERYGHL